jgi:hypothetical protein
MENKFDKNGYFEHIYTSQKKFFVGIKSNFHY